MTATIESAVPALADAGPPHSIEAEAVVLGSMLLDAAGAVPVVRGVLGDDPEPFYRPAHQILYRTFLARVDRGEPLDMVLLKGDLDRTRELQAVGGMDYVVSLVDGLPDAGNAEYYARIVHEAADKRELMQEAAQLLDDARQPGTQSAALVENLQDRLRKIGQGSNGGASHAFKTVRELVAAHPSLRPPVIHGLLREGESMNVVAQSKKGKSWLVADLALAVATGRLWLGAFQCERGDVLILDNELHKETSAYRLPKIAEARGIYMDEYGDRVTIDNLRGRLLNILNMPRYLASVPKGRYKVIILDALYRFWPPDTSENDNAAIASFYNIIDSMAERLGCCFVLIHHSSKGSQATKNLVDVGSGAGSIARAADTHLILVAHETDTQKAPAVVLDAGPRSFEPIEPRCLRFAWPVWEPAPDLDPTKLKPDRPRKPKQEKEEPVDTGPKVDQTVAYVAKYITKRPRTRAAIIDVAMQDGMSENRATKTLDAAVGRDLAFRWTFGRTEPVKIATVEQSSLVTETVKE